MKAVLILGNGFDLELDLKTSYNDFLKSFDFEDILKDNLLAQHLRTEQKIHNWIDLENELKVYVNEQEKLAKSKGQGTLSYIDKLKDDYTQIKYALRKYISGVFYTRNYDESTSAKVLNAVLDNGYFRIISFNYTDLDDISSRNLHKSIGNIQCEYIHGQITKHIILGVEDDPNPKIPREASFLKKSIDPNFGNNTIRKQLEESDIIIIFGHSLGATDMLYFKDFFNSWINRDVKANNKYIRIITKDNDSMSKLKMNISDINPNIRNLYSGETFKILRVNNVEDMGEINNMLEYLKTHS